MIVRTRIFVYSISHTPGAVFQARLLDNQEGANTERRRLRQALGEIFPTLTFLAPTLIQLWRYRRHEKSDQGGVMYTVVLYY